jgi:hypothetical protein
MARHTGIACKPGDEDDAVGDERGECAGVSTATQEIESDHECGVRDRQYSNPDQEPAPPRHGFNLAAEILRAVAGGSIDVDQRDDAADDEDVHA